MLATKDASREWALRTVAAIEEDQFREDGAPVPLDETSYYMGKLSDEALERLSRFLTDLSRRAPLGTPAWSATRTVIESLVSDISREMTKREKPDA